MLEGGASHYFPQLTTNLPVHHSREALMFLTYVWHSECVGLMAGRGPAELQPSVSDTHSWSPLTPAVLDHFECGLCIAATNTGSLSNALCLTSHLHPFLVYTSSISAPAKKIPLLQSEVGACSSEDFQPVRGVRRWGVPVSCESRNQTVGPEIAEGLGLLLILAFPRNSISVVSMSTTRKLTWMWKKRTGSDWFLTREETKEGFCPESNTNGWASDFGFYFNDAEVCFILWVKIHSFF